MEKINNNAVSVVGTLTMLGGVVLGLGAGYSAFSPKSVYEKDLNGDNRYDLVVETVKGDKYLFLQQEDGSYINFDEAQKLEKKSIEDKFE